MLYGIVAFGYEFTGDKLIFHETAARLANFLRDLPYTEELRVCFACILDACMSRKALDEWEQWLAYAEEQARLHRADWALAEHTWVRAYTLWFNGGDPEETIATMRYSYFLFERVGDAKRANWAEVGLGEILGDYGESRQAEDVLRASLPNVQVLNEEHVVDVLLKLASACMAQCKWHEAKDVLREALHAMEQGGQNPAEAVVFLGFTALAGGDKEEAVYRLSSALDLLDDPDHLPQRWHKWYLMINSYFANALYGLECALDDAKAFRCFCQDFRTRHPVTEQSAFQYWYLEPAETGKLPAVKVSVDPLEGPLSGEWAWIDPHGGCDCKMDHGLTIGSPVARDLLFPLINAPRMMRPVDGDLAAQVTCEPACADRPGIGGILLWQDKANYLRLNMGVRAQDETSLEGCIENKDVVIGRGRLVADPVTLRIERSGNTVRALCSADGQEWFSVGQVDFPTTGHLQIGLIAIGFPDRTIYHAPYPDGTAIRFTDFRLWN